MGSDRRDYIDTLSPKAGMLTSLESETADYLAGLMSGRRSMRRRYQTGECLRRSGLFTLYAKIFRLLLVKWDKLGFDEEASEEDEYSKELDSLVLPSNEDWRLRVYYRLVELQRESDKAAEAAELEDAGIEEISMSQHTPKRTPRRTRETRRSKKWDWEPDTRIRYPLAPRPSRTSNSVNSVSSVMLEASVEPGWRLKDILLAAKLLLGQQQQEYADEAEMRRVFGLVYDVLRYKQILDKALEDVGFWLRYGHLKQREKVVWLLLYDMQGRKFAKVSGTAALAMRNEALREAGLLEVEKALLATKTRLAASLSRLRIGGSALSLDELLPAHLRTAEGVTWGEEGAVASGWVNGAKISSRRQFVEEMNKLGLSLCSGCSPSSELQEDQYVFDPLCPKVVILHEKARERLAVSNLVRNHCFVFLERSLCVGAAALAQAMRVGKLCGPVILTHTIAPRHTGYLAELLADIEDAERLLVFGLGEKRIQHQAYLEKLGVSKRNCKLFSERYVDAPHSGEIERATIVLATPPCSHTGVRDVVDLAIARGGDLQLLESLTGLVAESPQQPHELLNEQMATLKHALTRPNVQFLVYEVHTLLPSETSEMIDRAVDHANRMAIDKYQREHPQRKKSHRESTGRRSKGRRSQSIEHIAKSPQLDEPKTNVESEDEHVTHHTENKIQNQIPDSDLFEMSDLNCVYEQDCSRFIDHGSFVILVKRKEMMQFNSLFMIKVAEAKGVFGEASKENIPKTPEQQQPVVPQEVSHATRRSTKRGKIEIDRIGAPTHASILRTLREKHQQCPRHLEHLEKEEITVESQQNLPERTPEPIPPLPPPVIQKSASDLHIELSSISNRMEEDTGTDKRPKNLNAYLGRKFKTLELALQHFHDINETKESNEIQDAQYANGDLDECMSSSMQSFDSLSDKKYRYEETFKDVDKSYIPFKKSSISSLPTLPSRCEEKGEGMFFNVSLKPLPHLNLRRRMLSRKAHKYARIPFQCRLETVYEQSQSFSYLFPEE